MTRKVLPLLAMRKMVTWSVGVRKRREEKEYGRRHRERKRGMKILAADHLKDHLK